MMESTTQLELFEGLPKDAPRPRPVFHIGMLSVRHDHLVLVALFALVTSSVVFALGVERGKRLARVERMLLAPAAASAAKPSGASEASKASPSATASETSEPEERKAAAPKAAPAKPRKTPVKVAASGGSKFAIQVSVYRQPTRAQQELKRLQQGGERAFLLKKSDRIAVLVGPFPNKAHAASKLSGLKQRYQDCFVKSL